MSLYFLTLISPIDSNSWGQGQSRVLECALHVYAGFLRVYLALQKVMVR